MDIYRVVAFDKSYIQDYLQMFDQENAGSVVCYCTHWNMTQEEIDQRIIEPVKKNEATLSQISREVAMEMINADKIHGYLIYEGKTPVGWCNCDDKKDYIFLARHVVAEVEEEKKVKSIVCLKVAKDKDFLQVGSALLESICKHSKAEGYAFIEAYPHQGAMLCADFGSALQVYLANGFQLRSMKNGEAILQKKL